MMTKKDLTIVVLSVFCLIAAVFTVVPTKSQDDRYDPWLDVNDDGIINILDIGKTAAAFGSSGDPTKNVNVTNWPSELLPNYFYDSGLPFIVLGPYPSNDSWTYRDFTIAGYRQVSVYVAQADNQASDLSVRIGMGGEFSHPAGYSWATYYNMTTIQNEIGGTLQSTIDVRGPQLTVEVYNLQPFSVSLRIAVYVTC